MGNDSYSGSQNPTPSYESAGNDQGYGNVKGSPSPYADKNNDGGAAPDAAGAAAPTPEAPASGMGNGVNLQPSYSNGGNAELGWSLMANYPNIKTVRIEIENGQEKTNAPRWIKEANDNGYQVIGTYHDKDNLESDQTSILLKAAKWWQDNYNKLKPSSGSLVVNLMNEWGSKKISAGSFAAAYNAAIPLVRTVYSGPIIIDLPGSGQGTAIASQAIVGSSGQVIADSNIILSIHIYPHADGSKGFLNKDGLNKLLKTGRTCMIGEFGDSKSGTVNWQDLVMDAKQKGWTVIGWAWGGDGSSPNKMNMIKGVVTDLMEKKGEFDPFVPASVMRYTQSQPYFNTIYNLL